MTTIMPPDKNQSQQQSGQGGDPLRPQHAVGERSSMLSLIRFSALALAGVAIIALLAVIMSASVKVTPRGGGCHLLKLRMRHFATGRMMRVV